MSRRRRLERAAHLVGLVEHVARHERTRARTEADLAARAIEETVESTRTIVRDADPWLARLAADGGMVAIERRRTEYEERIREADERHRSWEDQLRRTRAVDRLVERTIRREDDDRVRRDGRDLDDLVTGRRGDRRSPGGGW